jgi:CheY-like chemotaxis protein
VVVDDEAELRAMVAEYLGRYGFAVCIAASGSELDACLAENPADLLLLDVNMPDEDGFSIARRVRAHSDVPIVMLTAAGDIVDRVVGLNLAHSRDSEPFDRSIDVCIARTRRKVERDPAKPESHQDDARRRLHVHTSQALTRRRHTGETIEMHPTAVRHQQETRRCHACVMRRNRSPHQAEKRTMTLTEIALVRQSLERVVPVRQAAGLAFYDRLFAMDPSLRAAAISPVTQVPCATSIVSLPTRPISL